jgi:hypothetical protein
VQPDQPETPANKPAPHTAEAPASETPQAEVSDVEVLDEVVDAELVSPQTEQAEQLPMAQLVRAVKQHQKSPRKTPRLKIYVRAFLLVIAAGLIGVFVCAFRIYPYDDDGKPMTMSSHTQLGMPPCNFVAMTGKPCPSCGMTTSFALLVRGDVLSSLRANWVGSCLCVLWAVTMVWALASSLWGQMLLIPPRRGELIFTLIVSGVVVLMLARWAVILLQ